MVYYPINIEEALKKECRRRGYSLRTVSTYVYCINRFLKHVNKRMNLITKKDIRDYLDYLLDKGRSGNTLNTYLMAIKFLFENVLKRRIWVDFKYSKLRKRLPVVLSKEEAVLLFNAIKNPKHKLMIQFMYSSGLRVSEVVNLKVRDLEINRGFGFVRGGKGNKDRMFIVADVLKERLKKLIDDEGLTPNDYLFSSNRREKYSARTMEEIIKHASVSLGISSRKNISCHTLRHSFATHLIENNYSVSDVQSLLGHKSPDTTMIYVHTASNNVMRIKSPIDEL